jgi:nucleoside-diphosphate-sugar epimerase
MRVLVTGSAGFIGSHLCEQLAAEGDEVVGIDRKPTSGSVAQILLDLADPANRDRQRRWTNWADAVVHLAARPGVRTPGIAERLRDIITASRHLLDVMPPRGHLVAASPSSVYGGARSAGGRLRPSGEGDRVAPRGDYAESKARRELGLDLATDLNRVVCGQVEYRRHRIAGTCMA